MRAESGVTGPSRSTRRPARSRETLAYIHDDMRRAPGLERAAAALAEIELAERGATAPARRQGPARFLSRRALR